MMIRNKVMVVHLLIQSNQEKVLVKLQYNSQKERWLKMVKDMVLLDKKIEERT